DGAAAVTERACSTRSRITAPARSRLSLTSVPALTRSRTSSRSGSVARVRSVATTGRSRSSSSTSTPLSRSTMDTRLSEKNQSPATPTSRPRRKETKTFMLCLPFLRLALPRSRIPLHRHKACPTPPERPSPQEITGRSGHGDRLGNAREVFPAASNCTVPKGSLARCPSTGRLDRCSTVAAATQFQRLPDLVHPRSIRQGVRPEQFDVTLLLHVKRRAMKTEPARRRVVHEACRIIGAHLEQHSQAELRQRLAPERAKRVPVGVTGHDRMEPMTRAIRDEFLQTIRRGEFRPGRRVGELIVGAELPE